MSEPPIEALKAMAHPLRFRILDALREGERNVGELEEAARIAQPGLSQQLGVLRKAGLVATRKEAKLVYYRLAADRLSELAAVVQMLVPAPASRDIPGRAASSGAANFARLS